MSHDTSRRIDDGIQTTRHQVDLNHLAWQTLQRMAGLLDIPPVEEDQIATVSKILLKGIQCEGCYYANPAFSVSAPADTPEEEFFVAVKHAQREWLRELKSFLLKSRRLKRAMRAVHPLVRQLAFTGICIINSKHRSLHLI